ncbi:hypothetical protein, variant 2 [Saprolegnia diclina VS20]|uniref:Choline monooxygenase, chloroplastic n=1 Tax=Saprolegnia diclina (strain VS20) TaxID=1156394 RepID=T0RGZ8_SAPDV|nr:hypothetical protein SDRG_10746 [Saprolegnia diclina VS20]XP_008614973.1 hypothetical protein, variant 1 [Saprolegnia diclina VS20]XP_008614974.1 hypothetical protein, variant 2 [Saprolegnia diclina VS20]EQC31573.1 hypothetical protein SDRG_10746 [Saprolegnia diclina VS20]EQC31574.1 hypothetical protein, variant 1 [Saprolegnia diclina VS20]EQC31575.1 hypothetical protein, variant 2 [Saprolegnia diclina VS20]|eukprot:XP_008614972.1 hypothetical protein SDRG_10746 [Saprolegnia diclina VS20]
MFRRALAKRAWPQRAAMSSMGRHTGQRATLDLENVQSITPSRFTQESYFAELRKPVLEATTINPETYQSAEYHEKELERLFAKGWQIVGYTEKLKQPGDTIVATAAGQPIIVTRAKDNEIRGFYNVCRHRGAQLVEKNGRFPVISCPYHRWGYALDGRLLATPMFKGDGVSSEVDFGNEKEPTPAVKAAFSTECVKNFNKKDYGLLPVRIDTFGPFVYANVSGDAPPLKEYLGDLHETLVEYPFSDLVSYKSSTIPVQCNWKLLAENFMEYYHLPAVHPELCDVSRVDDHHRAQGTGSYIGFVTSPLTNGGTPLDLDLLPPMPGLSGVNQVTAWFHHYFPNAFYFLLPHGVYCVVLEPTGPNTTTEHAELLVHPNVYDAPDAEAKLQKMWDFYDMTNNQDLSICERVQVGIKAKNYKGGRMTFRFEETIHRFQNMVADYMTGKPKIPTGDESPPYAFERDFAAAKKDEARCA